MKTKKKRNPNDSTLRNVRAANRRIDVLRDDLLVMVGVCMGLENRIEKLEKKRGKK